jgi:hypothetical protein
MKIINLIVEIKIDDNVKDKYFDYELKYKSIEDFIEEVFQEIETSDDSYQEKGYSVNIKGDLASTHFVTFSKN